jgi:hypothetical protein
MLGRKQTEPDKTELNNTIRVAMQKGQSCFLLIHFELFSLFDPLVYFAPLPRS